MGKQKELKFIIHYSGDYKDSFVITGKSIKEIRKRVFEETEKRGWNSDKCWSEEVENG